LKVWDRRSIADGRPAGVFYGHTEGLTYIDSRNDGRYVLSNGKDQTAKLWDLRKVMSAGDLRRGEATRHLGGWDYRGELEELEAKVHPWDCSVVTFRGHSVQRTLIRCHFSPPGSSDSRFVYSGSQDGKVFIWNLDGTLKSTLDVMGATTYLKKRPKDDVESYWYGSGFQTVVRDASWHPGAPIIAATAWNGWGAGLGTCTIHSWNEGLDDEDSNSTKPAIYDARMILKDEMPSRSSRWRRAHPLSSNR